MDQTTADAVDFSAFTPGDTVKIEILAPDGATGTKWFWEIASLSHPISIAVQNEASQKSLRREKKLEVDRLNGRKIKIDEEDIEDRKVDNARFFAKKVLGWSPVKLPHVFGHNETVEFSEANVLKVFLHPKMAFVFSQVIDATNNDALFTKSSDQNSERGQSTTLG